jgi:hypothetical protein
VLQADLANAVEFSVDGLVHEAAEKAITGFGELLQSS